MAYLFLLTGFIFLVKGADFFVSGSSAIAKFFNIPAFIIGLTIVACGTSLPEAAISISAALKNANGIVVGNALGSNLLNLLVVLGASALIRPCPVSRSTLRFEYPLSILAAVILLILGMGAGEGVLAFSRLDGLLLLGIFMLFMITTVRKALRERAVAGTPDSAADAAPGAVEAQPLPELPSAPGAPDSAADAKMPGAPSLPRSILASLLGAAGIIIGGDLTVDAATTIAASFGIDETLIGLTVVALGTSLPELVTSVVAAFKGETDIAVGNVIGSNLFNLLFVLGLSITISPIRVTVFTAYDLLILIAASLVVLTPLARKQELTRSWGIFMLLLYGAYLSYIILRTI